MRINQYIVGLPFVIIDIVLTCLLNIVKHLFTLFIVMHCHGPCTSVGNAVLWSPTYVSAQNTGEADGQRVDC